ncbi:fluoroquinolone export ABC transporter permease subunit [Nocardia mexicana]|uniref:Fluoroquinolone transport system permease protein n=1 Tax=Nocardia mexicana TaxID=279262 RepID=A0A370GKX6_9NOCA|nr:hypothetical protein [Nocardia mexicana]RDI44422.1 fluoroquinolone transport system permease protein [Nocardia mexicana]
MIGTTPALAAAIRMDFRLQRRYGFYYATGFVIVLWAGVLAVVPDSLLGTAMPYVLMADLEFFLFFIAGAVFFEKGEGTLFALLSTPLRFGEYLTAKLVSMCTLALATCVVVSLVDYGPRFDPFALIGGALSMALLMILAGFVTAPLFPSISEWIMPSTLILTLAAVPLFDYSGVIQHPAFYLIPTEGSILLLGAAFDQVSLSGAQIAYALGYPTACIAGLCWVARRVFYAYVVNGEGGR